VERREESQGQSHKEEEREGRSGTAEDAQEPLVTEGWLHFGYLFCPPLANIYATADGAGLPT